MSRLVQVSTHHQTSGSIVTVGDLCSVHIYDEPNGLPKYYRVTIEEVISEYRDVCESAPRARCEP